MCLFRKKKDSEKAQDNRELISENEKAMDALIVLAEQAKNTEIIEEFKKIKETIKYLIPSTDGKVRDYDKKIKNLIGDLRIVMVKNDGESNDKANKLVTQLKLAIVDRNTKF